MKERLYNDEAAARAHVEPATWRRYCSARPGKPPIGPKRDGVTNDKGHARPYWYPGTIDNWLAGRAGQGARTDLTKTRADR